MRCALGFYFVVTIFVVVYSLPELCVVKDCFERKYALCRRDDVEHAFDFIPPISQNITNINLYRQPITQLPYNAFRNLSSQSSISEILLQDCQISHVDAGALLNLHSLTTIDLSHNYINKIDSKLFSDTKQIKFIYMDYNEIEVLPNGLFQNLTLLEQVRLKHNQIRRVERFSFKNTPSLWIIDLVYNQIEFMNVLFKDEFDNLAYIFLFGNPWRCNCELEPLYELLLKIKQLNDHRLVCEKPSTLHGRKWRDVSRDKFVCPSEDAVSAQDSVDTGIPQPPSNQNWIEYTRLVLVVVCVAAVITGVVFVVRHALAKSNVRLPTIVYRGSDRGTNARNMDSGLLPMCVVQSSAVSENDNSASNMADVDEKSVSIHQNGLREATIN